MLRKHAWADEEVAHELNDLVFLGKPELLYSNYTDKFYLSIPNVDIKDYLDDSVLTSICAHRDTKKEAVLDYSKRIKGAGVVIINAWGINRLAYKWDGEQFLEVHED